MGLIEPVFGEFRASIKNSIGGRLRDLSFDRARHEALALRIHLGLDLLAHGTPQEIGLGKAVAGKVAGDLLDLLLIRDHPERLAQDGFKLGKRILDRFFTILRAQ